MLEPTIEKGREKGENGVTYEKGCQVKSYTSP